MLKQTTICLSRTLHGGTTLLFAPPSKVPEEAPRNFFTKIRDPWDEPSLHPKHASGLRQDIQVGDGITPPTLYSEEKVRALKGVLHQRHPKKYPPYSPPVASHEEIISKHEETTPRPE